ncbi:hypothetical protein G7Z17_g12223 [Cylindrodendrum hubeiense]|uniref:Pectate lyase n=1 Tax=Cylindrodendrum hubeiense TaxID=595255 RepID=A0A9P5H1D4_9HYPO|nr:hypothetical protein G7Z17_g12223 [Cylindrodendrum hubeiense]
MQYRMTMAACLALSTAVFASPAQPQITKAPRAFHRQGKRSQPEAAGSSVLDAVMTIAAGESFDGGNVMYDRGVSCTGQEEGGDSDAVFILEAGASLSNVIIGPNQIEGVHCNGGCTITNVWWDAVCEDAFSIKLQESGETTNIIGGGAAGASDKVIQHNGGGTVIISDFTVSDFGKLYRSCGNCDDMPARHVQVSGGSATNGEILVGINSNMGDTASISGVTMSGVEDECIDFEGVTDGSEPTKVGTCSGTDSGTDTGSSVVSSAAASETTPVSSGGSTSDDDSTSDDEETNDDEEESNDDEEESNDDEESNDEEDEDDE